MYISLSGTSEFHPNKYEHIFRDGAGSLLITPISFNTCFSILFDHLNLTVPSQMYRKQVPVAVILVSASGYIRLRDLAVQLKLTVPSQMYTKRVPIGSICLYHTYLTFFGHLKRLGPSQMYTKPVPIAAIFRFRDITTGRM